MPFPDLGMFGEGARVRDEQSTTPGLIVQNRIDPIFSFLLSMDGQIRRVEQGYRLVQSTRSCGIGMGIDDGARSVMGKC